MNRLTGIALGLSLCLAPVIRAGNPPEAELIEVRKIWDRAPHNAFTDLLRHQGAWWCVFREGKDHVSSDGALRLLTSADGKAWTSVVLLADAGADLRDPKLCAAPDGKFMLTAAGALHKKDAARHQTFAWFSADGKKWLKPVPIGDPNFWLWRVTWLKDVAYSFGYSTAEREFIRLYRSKDGRGFNALVEDLNVAGAANETSIVFDKEEVAWCLLRRDPQPGMLGRAKSPYKDWTWRELAVRIGGPTMIELPDGRSLAAVRLYDKMVRTALCWVDRQQAKLTEILTLPSGGDTSYAGLVWQDDLLWVSYYSSHEGKTSIYLAKVKLRGK